jgi:hypothetical protein
LRRRGATRSDRKPQHRQFIAPVWRGWP